MDKSKLFKAAHSMTRRIRRLGDDYRATFGACLRYLIATEGRSVILSGKTYNARALISKFGGTYNGSTKTWTMPVRGWDYIRQLDNGRAVWGVVATTAESGLTGDWRTNPAFGYAEAV